MTNKVVLDREILEQLPNCRFIELLSTGYNVIDCGYAKERGIPVSNIPAYSTDAVAQLVFAFILAFSNRVAAHNRAVHAGEWTNCPDFCFSEDQFGQSLRGKRSASSASAESAKGWRNLPRPLACACSPAHRIPKITQINGVFSLGPTMDQLLAESDFVTLHCPLTPQTDHIVNQEFLQKMKPSAYLINTSRGPVIDEAALAQALEKGALAGAGVDVLSTEPPTADNPLLTAKNCLITPHIAWAGYETRGRLLRICEDNLRAFCAGAPIHVVNP